MIATSDSIPEVRESDPSIGTESLSYRRQLLSSVTDLGPQDLVTLLKDTDSTHKTFKKPTLSDKHSKDQHLSNKLTHQVGTYLYYTGLDNSSASSVAAHLNQLANLLSHKDGQTWFSKKVPFQVTKAIYSSYDAFRGVDVVVVVNLPGNVVVKAYNRHSEEVQESEELWKEVFVCGVVRALLGPEDDDEQVNSIVESRNLNPFAEKGTAEHFFDCFEDVFEFGAKLGCSAESGNGNMVDNYLIDGFFKAVEITGLYDYALKVLFRLRERFESVDFIVAKVYLSQGEEIKAVKQMHKGLQTNPRDANLLVLQSAYLTSKGKTDLSVPIAIQAVNSEPSSFKAWLNLSKAYLESNQISEALLTLNSTPMTPYREQTHHKKSRNLQMDELNLPQPSDVRIADVDSLGSNIVQAEHHEADQSLLNLQASNLRSTYAKGYRILTEIVHRVGWERLLEYRGDNFVMEEEYRTSKSTTAVNSTANLPDSTPPYEESTAQTTPQSTSNELSFKKKRLCERWLDHLFLILYDDLRTYTLWQGELMQFEAQNTNYQRSALEWEHLGMCALRLHHDREASIAFMQALNSRFAPTASRNLLRYYLAQVKETEERLQELQNTPREKQAHNPDVLTQLSKKITLLDDSMTPLVIKLTAWNHRWYTEFSPYLILALKQIVSREGLVRLQTEVKANYEPESGVEALMEDSWKYIEAFKLDGFDI
ncbi:hypothetical protein WICPIJ_004630 [Wickerhamomyces pijperi]|uniref:Bud site selection protein 7 n=1 Tax=Wickerhamomyces pijperi TaxID=599730 RepID=A0A9P8Q5K0_WICPI|nr:hypothetical protein WICPIJ_004630 [Wickerhamomyces pijperi]